MPSKAQTDWDEQRALVLAELKRLHEGIEEVKTKLDKLNNTELSDLKSEIAVMKSELRIKSGVWGLLAGSVPAIVALIYFVVSKHS